MTLTQIKKAGLDPIALDHVFTIGASGTDHYTFQGEGLNGTVNDPTLYLTRGKTYRFENGTGAHAIRIQSADNGTSGTLYNTGVTNNNTTGTVIVEVQHDAPDVLYYQCASHANMKGTIYITGALADGGVTTAKIADDAVDADKLANSINTAIAANTAKDLTALSASNLTSGTVPDARFPATLPAASGANLTNLPAANITGALPAISGANLTGLSSDSIVKNFTLASGASTTNAKIINTNQSGEVEQFPQLSSTGTPVAATDIGIVRYSKNVASQGYRVKYVVDNDGNAARITLYGQLLNADGTVTTSGTTAQFTSGSQSNNAGYLGGVSQWKAVGTTSYWVAYCRVKREPPTSTSSSAARYDKVSMQMFTVNNSTGAVALLGSKYNSNYLADASSVYGGNRYRLNSTTNVTMQYNSASVYHYIYSNYQMYQINHYQLTTSGLSQLRNTSAASNSSYSGTEHLQAWTSFAGEAIEITGTKTASLTNSTFDVHDFTGANNRLAIDSSTALNTGSNAYSTQGIGKFLGNGTHFIYCYQDINAKRKIQTYSYTQAGAFTLIDELHYETNDSALTASQIGSIRQLVVKSATEFAVLNYNTESGLYGLSSIKLDSSYNIEGIKQPLFIAGIQNTSQKTLHYSGSNELFFHFNVDSNGDSTKVPYTVNSYKDSVPFIYGGVAQETTSSGTASIALGGVATGFSGLTVGTKYYVATTLNGDITTATTSGIVVGTAIKTTEMLIGDVR